MTNDAARPKGSLTARLHAVYADLPAGERKAADFVLDRPGELAAFTGGELAEQVSVSNATVSRLFRRLGYNSYDEARQASRAMRAVGSPLYLAGGSQNLATVSRRFAADAEAVSATMAMTNPQAIREATSAIAAARRVRVAGFRNGFFAAEYGRAMFAQIRPDVALLTRAGQTLAEGVAELEAGDVAIVVGVRRRIAGFARLMETLGETGADVLLIADRSIRQSPSHARWFLTVAVETADTLDSYAGLMALMRLLAAETTEHLGSDARHVLERIERAHEALDELE